DRPRDEQGAAGRRGPGGRRRLLQLPGGGRARDDGPGRGRVGLMGDRTGRYSDDPVSIWSRRGTGISRVEDLAGRKVGAPVGGTADEYLGVVLQKKGVAREKVTVLNVPPGNLVSALQGGGVDAVAAWEPFGSLVRAKVPDAVLVVRGGGYMGYFINMAVHDDVIAKNPELVERYVIEAVEGAPHPPPPPPA